MEWNLVLLGAVSVVGFSNWLKKFDRESKMKNYYNWLPFILSIGVSLTITNLGEFGYWMWAMNFFTIMSVSVLGYQTIIEFVEKKISSMEEVIGKSR